MIQNVLFVRNRMRTHSDSVKDSSSGNDLEESVLIDSQAIEVSEIYDKTSNCYSTSKGKLCLNCEHKSNTDLKMLQDSEYFKINSIRSNHLSP